VTTSTFSQSELAAVIGRVQLVDVRLVSADVRTLVRDARVVPDANLAMRHATKVIGRSDGGFLVLAAMDANVVSGQAKADADPPIRMQVAFALQYELPDAASVSDAVLAEFARVNGAFNAWPYWREYIQTTAARMNLPPVVLPVFRVAPRAEPTAPALPSVPKATTEVRAKTLGRKQQSRKKR
jgi:hypothetical protein